MKNRAGYGVFPSQLKVLVKQRFVFITCERGKDMSSSSQNTTFSVNGYEVSATFADSRNTVAIGLMKQILLSSFVNTAKTHDGDILVLSPELRDNNGTENPCAP